MSLWQVEQANIRELHLYNVNLYISMAGAEAFVLRFTDSGRLKVGRENIQAYQIIAYRG